MLSKALRSITHMRCIPVIVSFSTDGEMKPLYTMINSVQLKIESYVQEIPHEADTPTAKARWVLIYINFQIYSKVYKTNLFL